jgi:hypothetical protein
VDDVAPFEEEAVELRALGAGPAVEVGEGLGTSADVIHARDGAYLEIEAVCPVGLLHKVKHLRALRIRVLPELPRHFGRDHDDVG